MNIGEARCKSCHATSSMGVLSHAAGCPEIPTNVNLGKVFGLDKTQSSETTIDNRLDEAGKEKVVLFNHGKPITIEVDSIERILYHLRPRQEHETHKQRVEAVQEAKAALLDYIEREIIGVVDAKYKEISARYKDETNPDPELNEEIKQTNSMHDYVRFHLDEIMAEQRNKLKGE